MTACCRICVPINVVNMRANRREFLSAADDVASANLAGVLAGDDATVFWRAGEENREVRFQGC